MTDDDVIVLLHRAAELAPDRLEREPAAVVSRRRTRRQATVAGAGLVAIAGLGAVVLPGALSDRQVLTPAGPPSVETQFFDLVLDARGYEDCLELPGVDLVVGPASLSPHAVISAVGTADERQAAQACLQERMSTVETRAPELRAVRVTADTSRAGPFDIAVSGTYPQMFSTAARLHDLTLTNTTGDPVFVKGLSLVPETPDELAVGCQLTVDPPEICAVGFDPIELAPGASRTYSLPLYALARDGPLPVGQHQVDIDVIYRSTGAFTQANDDADEQQARINLTYAITGPPPPDPARAAFIPDKGRHLMSGAEGRLGGDPVSGCLWLETGEGMRQPLLLRSDTARVDFSATPFTIVDGDDTLITEGEEAAVGGGLWLHAGVTGCPVGGQPFAGTLQTES